MISLGFGICSHQTYLCGNGCRRRGLGRGGLKQEKGAFFSVEKKRKKKKFKKK